MALAREKHWVIVWGDLRIRKNPHVMQAWKSAGHTVFFSETGLDQPSIVDADMEIREMLPRYPCSCRKGEKRKRVLRRD
jgi:hypothetical protein